VVRGMLGKMGRALIGGEGCVRCVGSMLCMFSSHVVRCLEERSMACGQSYVCVKLSVDSSTRLHIEHTCPPSTGACEQSDKISFDLCTREPGR